jgi:hypothetical protein
MSDTMKLIDMRSKPQYNSIQAPFGHLGISRSQMPQIDHKTRANFIQWLKTKGIKVRTIRVPIRSLKMSQGEYDRDKVMEIISSMLMGDKKKYDPLFVSSDGYVVDGNHRLIAKLNMNDSTYMDVAEISSPMMQLLDIIRECPYVRYKTLHDKPVGK